MKKKKKILDYTINPENISLGAKFQNMMYGDIRGRIIDTSGDSVKLLVTDIQTKEQAEGWYRKNTINDFWRLDLTGE